MILYKIDYFGKKIIMTAFNINRINSIILIILGLWGAWPYLFLNEGSVTSIIPVVFGLILIILGPGLDTECKIRSHIIVLLTVMILISLFMPLKGAVERGDISATIRLMLMIISSFTATLIFIKSFIDARKQKS